MHLIIRGGKHILSLHDKGYPAKFSTILCSLERSKHVSARPSIFITIFISAEENSEVQASTINAEQMVKDNGRGLASKVALVYEPLASLEESSAPISYSDQW